MVKNAQWYKASFLVQKLCFKEVSMTRFITFYSKVNPNEKCSTSYQDLVILSLFPVSAFCFNSFYFIALVSIFFLNC